MIAMQLKQVPGGTTLVPQELVPPTPGPDEVLIEVHAAGVTPTELIWYPTTHNREGSARLNAIPGHEFSGVVVSTGADVRGFQPGQAVYGMNDWFADGATAEFCVAESDGIALKPTKLSHEAAATVPIGALTAWQGLFERLKIQPGERLLVHGGTGAVGHFVVQLASQYGCEVVATASADRLEFVSSLGAAEVIDYAAGPFEDRVKTFDAVFDTVGGGTLARSWNVLSPTGRLVTIAASSEETKDTRAKGAFLLVVANHEQLVEVAARLDAGMLKTFVGLVVPLEAAGSAYGGSPHAGRRLGKTVVSIKS